MKKDNCLFVLTDYMYIQAHVDHIQDHLMNLKRKYPMVEWRVDTHPYIFVASPTLKIIGGTVYNNPNKLFDEEHFVWITCVPEECTCMVEDGKVIIEPGVYNLFNKSDYEKYND